MKCLFVHQNFPGQFKHLAPAMVKRGAEVVALSMKVHQPTRWQGVMILPVPLLKPLSEDHHAHPWLQDFNTKVVRAEAGYQVALALKKQGYYPDVIYAHPAWGESMFFKQV